MFENRTDAGKQLAEKLEKYRGQDAVVLALPRGGVVVGAEIAKELNFPIDIIVTRKIGHPGNPEYAICAVDEKGTLLCNEAERASVNEQWLQREVARERAEALRRSRAYRGERKALDIKGKIAIIADDGIATGLSIRLAIRSVKSYGAKQVVVAVPVAPSDVAREIAREVDEFVVIEPPEEFRGAVGAHYRHFDQTTDEQVVSILKNL